MTNLYHPEQVQQAAQEEFNVIYQRLLKRGYTEDEAVEQAVGWAVIEAESYTSYY